MSIAGAEKEQRVKRSLRELLGQGRKKRLKRKQSLQKGKEKSENEIWQIQENMVISTVAIERSVVRDLNAACSL